MSRKPEPSRDLEKEREELLRQLDANVSEETRSAIQIAVASLPESETPTISHSTEGASDASAQ